MLFDCEVFKLLRYNLTTTINLWFYLEFLGFELFLVVFIAHNIVEVSLHTSFHGVFENGGHCLAVMIDDKKFTLVRA